MKMINWNLLHWNLLKMYASEVFGPDAGMQFKDQDWGKTYLFRVSDLSGQRRNVDTTLNVKNHKIKAYYSVPVVGERISHIREIETFSVESTTVEDIIQWIRGQLTHRQL